MLHSLVTAHSFMSALAVVKRTQKTRSYGFLERLYRPVGPTRTVFVIQLTT
jgi:hypothetical protein